ncbi:adenylyltransferase/cytidyltransferase family protein [Alisedimentitalea sp. MJ-SS2]|uniref:adenylyltransferase/cytidyltransferase family protein n=1 Tax=Aliisedimentitalea sp. MJ-SS2 TaxID=3049795 RepID=UPI002907D05D|nr:adenylyltransferase/cytidyltransferase family protein [Alisedimentitalea sp. MJ-SS2]MDU8926546.1 adenylyltransferase/cytidyltransferase family protein [Alisedimentitalea sp. MJ-SS2]
MSAPHPKTILTYGTFDLFHVGHVRLLQRMAAMGDRLIVGCSSDEFNAIKGKKTVIPYEHRAEILLACRYVDDVFPENDWEQKPGDIHKYEVDTFVMGDDWTGKFDALSEHCTVHYLPRTPSISSTKVKKTLGEMAAAGHFPKLSDG